MTTLDLQLAGLRVRLRSPFGGGLGGLAVTWRGHAVPPRDRPAAEAGIDAGDDAGDDAGGEPGLEIDLVHDPALDGQPGRADHPAFARRRDGAALAVERSDVRGRIELGNPVRARFSVADDQYAIEACVRVALSAALPRHGALVLHASAVQHRGRASLFSGVSGAGKSTLAAMLDGVSGAARLADELVVLRAPGDDGGPWTVHVPPFLGIAGLPLGAAAPVASLDLLVQAPHHRRTALPPAAALRELLRHVVVYAAEAETADRVLALASRLVAEVPCHRLEFALDAGVAGALGFA